MKALALPPQAESPLLKVSFRNTKKTQDIDSLMTQVVQQDDYRAFEKLFNLAYYPLLGFCSRLVPARDVAEELVSEVFVKIWKNRKRITIASSGKSYLVTSVRNMAFDYMRKEKKSIWTDLSVAKMYHSELCNPHQLSELEELQGHIERAINKLPKKCRLIFQLSRDEGMKYAEIADILKLSPKTVETQMGRALKILRRSLKDIFHV
ncbi:MAG: RNA polymerase sigma-70 factor [Bacteroidota bacterium]